MISKNDLIMWFKALESYKRIDTMCTLLNMCLPFELRFLGTCLEELGRRDSQDLRNLDLRANNSQDLATDMIPCRKGEPTDKKVRRKMALYLALIRTCNRTNVTEIFRTLESWGELDFSTMNDIDTLKELLLVYTMAANHPIFEFDQHLKFMKIFEKIKENKLVADSPSTTASPPPQTQSSHQNCHLEQSMHMSQQLQQHVTSPSQQDFIQQHALHAAAMHPSGQHHQLLAPTPMHMLPQGSMPLNYQQSHLAKLIPTADGQSLQHQITTVDGIPHMISSNITIPDTSNAAAAILTHPTAASWAMRQYHQPPPPLAGSQQMMDHPPQASSPMLSQQSSPASSRATSPNRTSSNDSGLQQQQTTQQQQNNTQVRNMQRIGQSSLKSIRRPSAETTPPPPMMVNELIMPQNMKQIQELVMNNDGSGNQLQNLIRNGYTRSGNHPRIKSNTYIPPHQQQQQQSPVNQQHYQGSFGVNTGLSYSMQNMSISASDMSSSGHHSMDGSVGTMMSMNSNKSTGSDSGSSIGSSGEISPPETPTLMMNNVSNPAMRISASSGDIQQSQQLQQPTQKHHQPSQLSYNKQLGLTRLNGRSEKLLSSNTTGGGGNNVMTSSTIIYAQQPQQQQQQPSNQQAIYANEMLMGGPGSAGSTTIMQNSLTNNNSAGSSANVVSSNNNVVGNNTVLLSSPSGGGATLGNVISTNSVILQPHQQQYNAYHAAAAAAAVQHLAATSARPPIMTHNPGMAPPPHNTFRLPGFQLPPNGGELLYPAYHPAGGITFLSGAAPPGAPPVALRTSNSGAAVVSTQAVSQPPTPQQVPPPPQQLQQATPSATVIASPYTSLTTVGLATKPLSCYNCGSQTHSGRECQEASMEDVTRSAIYKLDYSQAATGAGAGTPTATTTPANQQQQPPQQQIANSASDSTISNHSQQKSHDSSAVQTISPVTASAVAASPSATSMVATATAGAK